MAIGRHLINVDLFTDAYRVSGRTPVATAGLLSELNNPNTDYLDMEDAYLSRIHEPGKIVANYSTACFRKSNINFVILQDRRDGTVVSHIHSVFGRERPLQIFLTVPSFEIAGEVMYDGKSTPSAILVQTIGRFQSVFSARASAALYPDISYTGDLILVHKDNIGLFCMQVEQS